VLGERPYPMKESLKEYLVELEERKHKEEEAANTPTEDSQKE